VWDALPDAAVTVIGYVPAGVPGFGGGPDELPPPPPPQAPAKPASARIKVAPDIHRGRALCSLLAIASAALNAMSMPAQASTPSRGAGSGDCGRRVRGATCEGAVVVNERFTMVIAAIPSEAGKGLGGLNTHADSLGKPVQLSVTAAGNGAPALVGVSVMVVLAGVPGGSEPEPELAHGVPMHIWKSVPTPKARLLLVMPPAVTETF
jgi:hypothetical protein